jgi:hypothetical protein
MKLVVFIWSGAAGAELDTERSGHTEVAGYRVG